MLPEAGTYKLRVYTGGDNPSWIGGYSFRTYSPVHAGPDTLATEPNTPLDVPIAVLLCNDAAEDEQDVLSIALPTTTTTAGGALKLSAGHLSYTPKASFTGTR